MNDETRHVIAHVARPSYPALELDCLANFQNKRHTLSRTLARVRLPTPRTQLSGHDARGRDGPHFRQTGISLWSFYQIPFIFQPSPAKATTQLNRATLHGTLLVEHYTKISQFCVQFRYNLKIRLLPWKGQTSPLPYTAAARRNLTREYFRDHIR